MELYIQFPKIVQKPFHNKKRKEKKVKLWFLAEAQNKWSSTNSGEISIRKKPKEKKVWYHNYFKRNLYYQYLCLKSNILRIKEEIKNTKKKTPQLKKTSFHFTKTKAHTNILQAKWKLHLFNHVPLISWNFSRKVAHATEFIREQRYRGVFGTSY